MKTENNNNIGTDFDEVKEAIEKYLLDYQMIQEKEAKLFIIDEKAVTFLKECELKLFTRYSGDPALYKEFNLSNIVKVINFKEPANWYRTFCAYHWREINNKDAVLKALAGELEKHFNKLKTNVKKQFKNKQLSKESEDKALRNINNEYEIALKEVEYIKANKDSLEMRISAYHRRKVYPRVDYKINKIRQTAVQLKKTSLNALWFKELEEDEKHNINNELILFLKDAKNPFGDFFYRPIVEEREHE